MIFWVIVLIVLAWWWWHQNKSTFDSDFVNPRSSSEQERLDELIRRGDKLVDYVKLKKYPNLAVSERIVRNWDILRAGRRIGITPSSTDTPGFVINKTSAMQLCVTKKPGTVGDIDDINTASFVLIHEIAHLGAIEFEHGSEFIDVFKSLLRASMEIGIWTYTDYAKNPKMYCDYNVNATPKL